MNEIDGRKVSYRGKSTWVGHVQGAASTPNHVRVMWETPRVQTGIHKITDLVVLDREPTQQELVDEFNKQEQARPFQ